MEMWMKMKAMEGCFGEELVKAHMIKMKRTADKDVYDLGSKLHEKLEHKKEHMEEMYGNMTCMLRECQVLDSENKFYPEGIKMEWDEWKNKIEDDWLRSQLEKYCDQCIEFAENLPQSMLDDCPWGGEMVKTKMYMKCMMKKKVKTCMRKDIIDKLVKETKIPEYELYEIVKQMLKGPEMMMMEMS